MADKKKVGIIVAAISTLLGVLGFVFYKLFPMIREKCCPPKKKK